MIKWIKDKIIYFLIGGVCLAGTVAVLPENELTITEQVQQHGIETVLQDKTAHKKAQIKSDLYSEIKFNDVPFSKGDYKIKIVGDITPIEVNGQHGIELFAKAWKNGKQLGFGKDGTVEIERFRIYNPPVLVDDPNGEIVREWTDEITKEVKQRKLKYDPAEAIKQSLSHTIGLVGKDRKNIIKGKVGNTTSTFYPAAGTGNTTVDGYARELYALGAGLAWATIQGNAGNSSADTAVSGNVCAISSDADQVDKWRQIARGIYTFNTAVISTDTISSAIFSVYGTAESDGLVGASVNIYSSAPANDNAVVNGDYNSLGTTAFSTAKAIIEDTVVDAYNDFTLNASGKSAINKTGITRLGAREATWDAPNSSPTDNDDQSYFQGYFADETGTATDPKLVVVHELAVSRRIIIIQ